MNNLQLFDSLSTIYDDNIYECFEQWEQDNELETPTDSGYPDSFKEFYILECKEEHDETIIKTEQFKQQQQQSN